MTKFNDGVDGITSFGQTRLNNINRELRNSIENASLAINDSDFEQVSKAMANYSAVGTFYTDSGAADVYVLTAIDNFKPLQSLINGAKARFRAGNNNTGASTANVAGTGVRDIKLPDGTTNPAAGDISTTQDTKIRYNLAADVWTLDNNKASETVAGIVERLTDSELSIGTDTTRYASAANLLSLFGASSQSANPGYARIPINIGGAFDEIIIQWGEQSVAADTLINDTLGLTYPNAHLQAFASSGNTNVGHQLRIGANPASLTQIQLINSDSLTHNIRWFSIGH